MERATLSNVLAMLRTYKFAWVVLLIWLFVDQGIQLSEGIRAFSSTYWMQIFSFQDYGEPEAFQQYLLDLRTGIPPLYSALEIYSFNTWQDNTWIFEDLYQLGMITMCLLPLFFTRGKEVLLVVGLLVGWVFFRATLLIHPGNPQYYDVLLPCFLLLYLLFSEASFALKNWRFIAPLMAFLAGLWLGIAELSRPFMLALLPFLVAYSFFHYLRQKQYLSLAIFLLPLLIVSGGWHAKLYLHNNGQIIWSNSSGTNLYRAWSFMVDNEALEGKLQEEAPPLLYGRWNNLNTQVHYENSQVRKTYVWKAIRENPGKALHRIWVKTLIFIHPQTDLYSHQPRGNYIAIYKILVKGIYLLFPILVVLGTRKIIKKPSYFFSQEWMVVFITGFLSFMPIIGESGEEARFLISVLPFLLICGILLVEHGTSLVKHPKLNRVFNFS